MFLDVGLSQQLALCRLQGAATIVASMNMHKENPDLQCYAVLSLTRLVEGCPEAQVAATRAGAASSIVETMRRFSDFDELQACGATALAVLSRGCESATMAVCAASGPEVVLASICRPYTGEAGEALQRGCECLAIFLESKQCFIPWIDLSEALTGVMLIGPSAEVQIAACWAFEEMAKTEFAAATSIFEAGGVSAIISALSRLESPASVVEGCCRVLGAVARATDAVGTHPLRAECLSAGAAKAVATAMTTALQRCPEAPKAASRSIRASCATIQALVGDDDESAAKVAAAGASKVLEAWQSQHVQRSEPLQKCCIEALRCICMRHCGQELVEEALDAASIEQRERILHLISTR